ncbi:TPA: hypothetical protein DCG86_07770 [Candidatus Marinimicrobia bacterium]|nr:hypothetical protein [Candidatus Neomarinimicrobiota bacterium]
MESKIATARELRYSPVAVLFTDDKPENAMQFKEGRWGCVVTMFIAAAKGRTAIFDRKTFGCLGGGVGLGFGNQYVHFPGGIECYVSTGNKEFARTPEAANFRTSTPLDEGEGYFKSSEIAKKFVDALPMTEVPTTYVVFKPLDQLTEEETPEVVVFLANVEQLSALSVLANYDRGIGPSVIMPFGAGCHTLGIIPYAEAKSGEPRAVIGLTDISARRHVDKNLLSFAVPFSMFLKMEENVDISFLKKEVWINLMERNN